VDYSIHTMKIDQMLVQFWDAIEYNRNEEALVLAQSIKFESVLLLKATELAVEEFRMIQEAQARTKMRNLA
jgi:hypothetical protein